MFGSDPLKIYYLLVIAAEKPEDTSPFQGFSNSWPDIHWALRMLATLPADVLERSYKLDDVIAQRIGGARPQAWVPINLTAVEQLKPDDIGLFTVVFTGDPDSARRAQAWIGALPYPVLHISNQAIDGCCFAEDFTDESLREFCLRAFEVRSAALDKARREAAKTCLAKWKEPQLLPSGLEEKGHNVTLPNYISLLRASRSVGKGSPFIGQSEAEYTAVILDSIRAVYRVREQVGLRPFHRMTLIQPPLILTEPALYRDTYKRLNIEGPLEEKVVAKALRSLQTQRGLRSVADVEFIKGLMASRIAQVVINFRQEELQTHTLGVGLSAAQSCSAVTRLSPGVNHVFPSLSAYARNVRSSKMEGRLKTRRLFAKIQADLKQAVGDERIAFIQETGGPIKIVCDAPMEWLPVGNLPLSLRYLCSRINATPGNLMMGLLAPSPHLTFAPKDLQKILLLSSFTPADPLRYVLRRALEVTKDGWEGKVELVSREANSKQEFIDTLNAFDGHILVFDGHGADNADDPVSKLIIGGETVDVWELRGHARVPPIVILSACDTQQIDASSHATVGNGFLALGARTVLATLLPVGGNSSAAFIARLVYRIAEFLPAALKAEVHVLNWTGVITGMVQMLFASEMLDYLVGPPEPEGSPRWGMQTAANIDINSGEERWFDNILDRVAIHLGQERNSLESRAKGFIGRTEAIRYVQLGSPEQILIDDGQIRARVLKEYSGREKEAEVGAKGVLG